MANGSRGGRGAGESRNRPDPGKLGFPWDISDTITAGLHAGRERQCFPWFSGCGPRHHQPSVSVGRRGAEALRMAEASIGPGTARLWGRWCASSTPPAGPMQGASCSRCMRPPGRHRRGGVAAWISGPPASDPRRSLRRATYPPLHSSLNPAQQTSNADRQGSELGSDSMLVQSWRSLSGILLEGVVHGP